MSNKSITLIELVIFIAVVAIALIPVISLFNYALGRVGTNQIMTRAVLLAEGLMEEISDDDFFSFKGVNETNDPNTFDILNGNFDSWFEPGWHFRVQYRYINPNTADLGQSAAELAVGSRSNFLRVYLEVWHQNFSDKRARLWSILTPRTY
jgi:type II secretory pathway pseudopilin PulG